MQRNATKYNENEGLFSAVNNKKRKVCYLANRLKIKPSVSLSGYQDSNLGPPAPKAKIEV